MQIYSLGERDGAKDLPWCLVTELMLHVDFIVLAKELWIIDKVRLVTEGIKNHMSGRINWVERKNVGRQTAK